MRTTERVPVALLRERYAKLNAENNRLWALIDDLNSQRITLRDGCQAAIESLTCAVRPADPQTECDCYACEARRGVVLALEATKPAANEIDIKPAMDLREAAAALLALVGTEVTSHDPRWPQSGPIFDKLRKALAAMEGIR